jgi:CRISPR-associated protein Cmr6
MRGPDRQEWLARTTAEPVGDPDLLDELHRRRARLVEQIGGTLAHFETDSRLVPRAGLDGPAGRGIRWHPTHAVPYLPGSSVKGLLRTWAQRWAGVEDEKIDAVFGASDRPGALLVLDALPLGPVPLCLEVFCEHYGDYIRGDAPQPDEPTHHGRADSAPQEAIAAPDEWSTPRAYDFLAVEEGVPYCFAMAPRDPRDAAHRDAVEEAFGWLREALVWLGAGSHGAIGFGRFRPLGDATSSMRSPGVEPDFEERPPPEQLEPDEPAPPDERAVLWLEEALDEVVREHGRDRESAIKSPELAELWEQIDDDVLRQTVRDRLYEMWDDRGWIENRRIASRFRKDTYEF